MRSLRRLEYLAIIWLVLTVAMASWWMIFGLHQIDRLHQFMPQMADSLAGQRHMLIWEGLAWIILLIFGGIWLLALIFREKKQNNKVREFFAVFNHELKTSLSSLRLQVECLQEELAGQKSQYLNRLLHDSIRLQLQLENSLMMAAENNLKAVMTKVEVRALLEKLKERFSQIEFEVNFSSAQVLADEKLLESVLSNLIHNAIQHGKATKIRFDKELGSDSVHIVFKDNGKGYSGSLENLGVLFQRATSTSGTGIGLYIVKILLTAMKGNLKISNFASNPQNAEKGFGGVLILRPV